MSLRAVTYLCRSEESAQLAAYAVKGCLGAIGGDVERKQAEGVTSLILHIPTAGLIFNFATTPDKWQWRDRKTFPQEQLRMMSAHACETIDSAALCDRQEAAAFESTLELIDTWKRGAHADHADLTASRNASCQGGGCGGAGQCSQAEGPEPSSSSSSFFSKIANSAIMTSLKQQLGSGYSLGKSVHILQVPSFSSESASASSSASVRDEGLSLKELVVGADNMAVFAKNQAVLEALGLQRQKAAPSIWQAAGQSFGWRLLPSRYSTLVARTLEGRGLEQEQQRIMRTLKELAGPVTSYSSSAPASHSDLFALLAPQLHVHGSRKGDDASGQLTLVSNALAGLELRVCATPHLTPYFSEHQDAYFDQIDPNLNPVHEQQSVINGVEGGGTNGIVAAAAASPGCSHVVMKVNLSIAKQKLGFELR